MTMKKRLSITVAAALLVACTLLLAQTNHSPRVTTDQTWANSSQYDKGANDALKAITLLSLELRLKGERKTWGEMCEIVRKRLRVTPPEATKFYDAQ